MGEAADISAIPDVMKEPATAPIARCPSALEKLLEVEWRAWLDSGTLPVGQIVQRDPFGDGSAIRANLNGDISEGPAGRAHPFGVDEQGLAGKPALATYDFVAIARDSRKPWSADASTDGCHLPLDVLAQILHQMEAIGHLPGCRRAFPDALGIEPTAITAHEFDPGMLLQPVRGPMCGAGLQNVRYRAPLKINDNGSVSEAFAPAPVVDRNGAQRFDFTLFPDMALQLPQDGVVADRHSQARQQPFADPAAGGMGEQSNEFANSLCFPRGR